MSLQRVAGPRVDTSIGASPPSMRSSLSISTGGDGLGDALNGVLSPGNAQPVQPGSVPKPLRRIKPLRELHTRLNIFNVTQLDTKKQIFTANLYYEVAWEPSTPADRAWVMAWTDAKEDNLARAELEKKENMPFDPKVHFANMDVDPVSEERFVAYEENYSGKGISFICERKKLMGASFNNQLALKHFPFDVQDLSIKVRTDQPLDKARLVANVYLPCDGRPSEFTTSNEFTYDSKIYYQNRLEKGARGGGAFTLVAFRLKANRKPGFVIFNVFVPILFISVLGLTVFTIDEVEPNEDFEKRFVVNGSLLLTLVAYKFSTSNNLPAVNYQTFGDKYVLFSVFLQVALVAWSAILVNFVTDDRDGVDRNAFIVFSAVFALWMCVSRCFSSQRSRSTACATAAPPPTATAACASGCRTW